MIAVEVEFDVILRDWEAMKRREFITLLSGAAVSGHSPARAGN